MSTGVIGYPINNHFHPQLMLFESFAQDVDLFISKVLINEIDIVLRKIEEFIDGPLLFLLLLELLLELSVKIFTSDTATLRTNGIQNFLIFLRNHKLTQR